MLNYDYFRGPNKIYFTKGLKIFLSFSFCRTLMSFFTELDTKKYIVNIVFCVTQPVLKIQGEYFKLPSNTLLGIKATFS